MDFYNSLIKPGWTPPDAVFPVMWFSLWTLQAIAVFAMLSSDRDGKRIAFATFVAQFIISIAWQAVVFGPGRLRLAAFWLIGATVLVALTVILFARLNKIAGALMVPTMVWMCVATALGWTLWRLNPGA